jgi:tripartite-type tricarboxylate transporter receptor subunit TctC
MGQPGVEFDARKFEYIGAPQTAGVACVLTKASGISSMDAWISSGKLLRFGGTGFGSYATENVPRVLKAALGLPIQIISGYKGIAEIRLAAQGGEVDGIFASWNGVRVSWRSDLEARNAVAVLQATPKPYNDLPNVPLAISLAKTDEARRLIEAGVHSPGIFVWPLVLPPRTPKERLLVLRKAFEETFRNKEFLAEAENAKLGIEPVSGEELEKVISGFFQTDPALLAKLKKIIYEQ